MKTRVSLKYIVTDCSLSVSITLGVKDFKYKNSILCLASKNAKKLDCLKCIVACLCYSTTEILNISYPFILWMVLPFNTFLLDGNRRSYSFTQSRS